MKVAILSCVLGGFDTLIDPVKQESEHEITFHRWTDDNFPPCVGLTPRLQYRIPKIFGWQMLPGYDYYIWLDGVMSFEDSKSVDWYIEQLGDGDIAFFRHPSRATIQEEVDHIEDHLQRGKPYITSRYKGGFHQEQLEDIKLDSAYTDDKLYASTSFIYRDSEKLRDMMRLWWLHQSRYFTCDQVVLPYILWKSGLDVRVLDEHIYKNKYMTMVGGHK